MLRESYAFSTLCRPPPSPVPSRAHCAPAAARTKHRPAERAPALPYGVPCPSSIRPFPHPPPPSLFPSCFPHYLTSSSYFLSPSATPRSSFGTAADFSATIPPPLVSPLIGAAADYSATFPPPLVSPLMGAAADYSATFPPLVSPFIGLAVDYFAIFPPPLVFSSHRLSSRLLSLLFLFLPSAAQQQTTPPLFLHLLYLSPHLLCSCFLLLMVTSLALPSLPLLFLQLAPDGSAVNFPSWLNCLERMLFGTLVSGFNLWFRLVATTQATATGAPDNAAARDLARILAESLESTRKHLTAHLAAPNPRCASTPLSSAPSHSDLLADLHVANACACQVIPACLPPTLLAQCSHIRSAKDLLGYLTERYQSQTPIGVIALLRELTSLRLADFTTMADYIARVQTLSS
ncbi:unnamed protein product [Closterium sp. NIES-65]|nr:unnamed protein product [Closterium sp. NIES-65]